MSFLGDALGSAPAAAAASAVSPTPQPDSPLVFGLKLFGVGAAIVAVGAYLSHRIAERDALHLDKEKD